MINNTLHIADTHLGIRKDNEIWLQVVKDVFEEMISFYSPQSINTIIHYGDFFHEKKISIRSLIVATEIAELLTKNNYHMIIIPGNHDSFEKHSSELNSLVVFKNYDCIDVITTPTVYHNTTFVPWGFKPNEISPNKYLIGHFEINGFPMNDKMDCRSDILPESLNKFSHVFSGHFHTPSKKGNIQYIGAPYQQTFHDCDGKRGFYWLTEYNTMKFVEFTKYPKFVRINSDVENIEQSMIEGNIVELIFLEDYGPKRNKELIEMIEGFNPLRFHTNFARIKITESVEIIKNLEYKSNKQILDEYVDNVNLPVSLNKKMLKKILNL